MKGTERRNGGTAVGTRCLLILLLVLLAASALSTGLRAEAVPPFPRSPVPPPGSALTVYVMTMGPGDAIWERFGHNAIWIVDSLHGTSIAYNYGLFDFEQEGFLVRFLRGKMLYWMAGFPGLAYARTYVRDNRSVWIQELNLAPEARLRLQDFLVWNARPENKFYRYDYYRDNCSTRVRDALDRVLGGQIRAQTDTIATGTSYRFHTERLTAPDPLLFTGITLALGRPTDRELSVWDEMFIPLELRESLRRVQIAGPDGRPVPLVKSERTLFQSTAFRARPAAPAWFGRYLVIGLIVGVALALSGRAAPRSALARRGFSGLATVWTLLVGAAGLILTMLWAITDHSAAYWNENLLQVNLLALPLVVLAPRAVSGARWAVRPALVLSALAAAIAFGGALLKLHPAFVQQNVEMIALFLPAHLGLFAGLWMAGRQAGWVADAATAGRLDGSAAEAATAGR